jgi:hypothetical protein
MIPDRKGVGLSRRETFEIMRSRSLRAQVSEAPVGLSSNARSTYTLCQ